MTTITNIEVKTKEWQGKKSTSTIVTLADGTTGYLNEKGSDKVTKGDSVDCVLEVKQNSKGGDYNLLTLKRAVSTATQPPDKLLTPPITPKPSVNVAPQSTSIVTLKANASVKAMEFCVNAFIADKITWDKIKDYHKEITGYLNDAIDECNS